MARPHICHSFQNNFFLTGKDKLAKSTPIISINSSSILTFIFYVFISVFTPIPGFLGIYLNVNLKKNYQVGFKIVCSRSKI